MFSALFSALKKPVIYIQISPERLTLKNLKTGKTIAEVPELAISKSPRPTILAFGSEARRAAASQPADILNPFTHPRSLASDFQVAELLLKYQVRRILGNPALLVDHLLQSPAIRAIVRLLAIAPHIVIHPLGSPEGGFTQVERRAFRDMALQAGASEVLLCEFGRPLTDQEVLSAIANPDQPPKSGMWNAWNANN